MELNRKKGEMDLNNKEDMIRVNGFAQVLEMLRVADHEFRETILRGIEKRDPRLARELRREL